MLAGLAPLWLMGMFGRGLWTPDEPREADIAWRMSLQADKALPHLGGTPFLEKPPLSYWVAAAGIGAFGDSPGAARAANLAYAAVTVLALAALALAAGLAGETALVVGLIAGSTLLAYRVASWLAPDAALLAGNALALLGLWRGYRAAPGKAKLTGYALMHLGAALGFMAKSAPGWLVPGLALLVLILWERRFAELRRWELYAGLVLQALIIGPWIAAVAHTSEGAEALHTLLWNNIVGRFTQVAAAPGLDYTRGHPNWPGKYWLELPVYLLPWTLIAAAALVRSWSRARAADGAPWRFALSASLPFLLLLSVAATARDIYAAPALLGLALLAGLWAAEAERSASALDRNCLRATRWLIGGLGALLAAGLILLAFAQAAAPLTCAAAAAAVCVFGLPALGAARAAEAQGRFGAALALCYTAWAGALCLTALVAFPLIDRGQDLARLARQVHADTREQPLALLAPDETTLAIMDHGYHGSLSVLTGTDARAVRGWFAARGGAARVLVLLPGHASGPLTPWLAPWRHSSPPNDGLAGELIARREARLVARYELPHGRRYALLGPFLPPAT